MNAESRPRRSHFLTRLRRFVNDRSGGVMVAFTLAAPFVIALIGFGLDAGMIYRIKRSEQTAADAGALAGAIELSKGVSSVVTTAAIRGAAANGFANVSPVVVAVNNPPGSGTYAGNSAAVEVIITTEQPRLMPMALLSAGATDQATTIVSRSVAMAQPTGEACVLALDTTAASAITNHGNATIGMEGCTMAANSNNASAISIGGSAVLTADSLWTAGDYVQGGSSTMNLTNGAKTKMWPLSDPYAGLTIPSFAACTAANTARKIDAGSTSLSPGTYCDGLDIGANAVVDLAPGTYYIDRGDLKINGQATVKCTACVEPNGVTFVFTSSTSASLIGTANINGGADINLSAPTEGYFKGLLLVQDRRASTTAVTKLNGGATQIMKGAIYFPQQKVEWAGTTGTTSGGCIEIIARLVTFIGNSKLDNSGCAAAGVEPVRISQSKLVE